MTKRVGILALQGGYEAHQKHCQKLGYDVQLITKTKHFDGLDYLILPGGETTTLLKFFEKEPQLWVALQKAVNELPTLGTCAGAILLANKVTSPQQKSIGGINVTVARNAYGRQVDSHLTEGKLTFTQLNIPMMFIRAPKITEIGEDVEVLAYCGDEVVCVKQGRMMMATFHPELTADTTCHKYFLSLK